jgi:Tfp pilus assembly protein PilN
MQSCLSIPVAVLDPFRHFRSAMPRERLAALKPIAGMALAGGLGLRDLARAHEIDLIPAEHLRERELRRWIGSAAVAALALLACTALLRGAIGLGLDRERPLAQSLRQEQAAAAAQRSELAALSQRRQALEARLAAVHALQRPGEASGWQRALHSVDAAFGPGLWFNQLSFTQAPLALPADGPGASAAAALGRAQALEIRAHAVDHARVTGFIRQLGEQPGLRSVRLVDTGVRRYPGAEVIDFTASAQVDALPGSLP